MIQRVDIESRGVERIGWHSSDNRCRRRQAAAERMSRCCNIGGTEHRGDVHRQLNRALILPAP